MDPSGDCELSAAKASAEEAGLNLTRYDFYRMILFLASPTIFLRFFSLPRAFILTALALSYDKPHISGDKRFSKRLLILSHLEYYFFFFFGESKLRCIFVENFYQSKTGLLDYVSC